MIIDILSDLHVDFYFRKPYITEEAVRSLYSHIFTDNEKREPGDVLIVAGDIGHNNDQSVVVLHWIKKIFGYKHIVCVLGNHDYYLISNNSKKNYVKNSLNRVEGMRNLINNQEGMHCLDGNIVEIDGVRIGGCDSWYDGKYIKKHFDEDGNKRHLWDRPINDNYIHQLWNQSLNDTNYIYGMDWREYAELEKKKIEKIYKHVDVMVTHVNPSVKKEHTNVSYREEETTGFFTFDGAKYLREGSMKYWIYGHTHMEAEYEIEGVKCVCNPIGYPGESGNGELTQIKSIEI